MRPIGDKLVIATHNTGKLREIATLIGPLGIACVGAEELGLPEPEEIGNTFVDNADLKAREAADLSGLPALADDSGISVDALHGLAHPLPSSCPHSLDPSCVCARQCHESERRVPN